MTVRPPFAATRARPGWTLALTALAGFMVALDTMVVIAALPAIHRDLHATVATLEWTVNAYTLTFAAGIVTAAALGDRLGRRLVFVLGLLLFSAASAACALAPTAGLLIASRAIQGLGAAAVTPLSLTLLASAFPARRRGQIIGIWGGLTGLAIAGGPIVGGAVIQGLDWHWIFWVNVPIGLACAALSRRRLAESHGPATRLDPLGVVLVSAAGGGLVWGLVRAGTAGWGSVASIAALGLGAASLVGFVLWERRRPEPMLPMRLFANRAFSAATATGFLTSASVFAAAFLTAQYFQLVQADSPLQAGLRFLPYTATPLVVAPLAGAVSDRIGQRPLMAMGLAMEAIGLGWFALVATGGAGYGQLILPMLLAGIGVSMPFATAVTAAVGAVAPRDLGKASGVNSTLQRFGGAFGVATVTAVFAANGRLGTAAGFTAGFRPALAVAAGLAAVGAVTALAVRRPARGSVPIPMAAERAA